MTRREILRAVIKELKNEFGINESFKMDSIEDCKKAIRSMIASKIDMAVELEKASNIELKNRCCSLLEKNRELQQENRRLKNEYQDLFCILKNINFTPEKKSIFKRIFGG